MTTSTASISETARLAPRVFISHASEDKQRFVLDFARRLREHGIDAWLDQWEIAPGDSLIDKIFTDGIGSADVIIVVLSYASVDKPWVREEINVGFMQRIKGKARLLPIVLDECPIPIVLETLQYLRIPQTGYDAQVQHIIDTIFQVSTKPLLGTAPRYTRLAIEKLPGLTTVDTLVFRAAVEQTLDANLHAIGTASWYQMLTTTFDLRVEQIDESLHILEDHHLIDIKRTARGHVLMFKVLPYGLENFGRHFILDCDKLVTQTLRAIVNEQIVTTDGLAEHLGQSRNLVVLALSILEYNRYILLSPAFLAGEGGHVREVTPLGRRFANTYES